MSLEDSKCWAAADMPVLCLLSLHLGYPYQEEVGAAEVEMVTYSWLVGAVEADLIFADFPWKLVLVVFVSFVGAACPKHVSRE